MTFGTGSVRSLAQPADLERAVLLVSADAGVRQALDGAFANRGMSLEGVRILEKPAGEPTAGSVADAAGWLAADRFDTLIAVGGGSVLDWARLSLAASKGWLDVSTGRIQPDLRAADRPSLVLVPTTCGSGAEAAAVAVYSRDGQKTAVVSDAFLADRVVLDAQFLASASPAALASWASDAISHGIESFCSIVPNGLAKATAVAALRMVLENFREADPHHRRERLMEAGYLGGVAASNCSVGIVHAFAHTVAAYGVPHGVGNALALPAGVTANRDTAEMAALLTRLDLSSTDALTDAIRPVTSEALRAGLPDRVLDALGNPAERDSIAARMSTDVCLRTNPRRIDRDGLMAFLDDVERSVTRV